MDKFLKVEVFDVVEDKESNITYLSKLEDSYLDLRKTSDQEIFGHIKKTFNKKGNLYFSPLKDRVLRLVPIDYLPFEMPVELYAENEPEIQIQNQENDSEN